MASYSSAGTDSLFITAADGLRSWRARPLTIAVRLELDASTFTDIGDFVGSLACAFTATLPCKGLPLAAPDPGVAGGKTRLAIVLSPGETSNLGFGLPPALRVW